MIEKIAEGRWQGRGFTDAIGRILVVEKDEPTRRSLCRVLKARGHTVFDVENAEKGIGFLGQIIDVVVCDIRADTLHDVDLLGLWKKQRPKTQFILVVHEATVIGAVAAIKAGAYDYLTRPQSSQKLAELVEHALESEEIPGESKAAQPPLSLAANRIIGQTPQMKQIFSRIERAAAVDSTVLILGENGTGKELVAQALHQKSPRRKGPFVPVNVAAVPATLIESELFGHVRGAFTGATDRRIGRFEEANGGTLFIDEIGDFDFALQPKLLRVLETLTFTPVGGQGDRKVDLRVIAATSRNVPNMVRQGVFREDLYYRLNVVQIAIPPLRERKEDIPGLVDHFLKDISRRQGGEAHRLSGEVMRRFLAYPWPGNVRELNNVLESMTVLADSQMLSEHDLPSHIGLLAGMPEISIEVPSGMTMLKLEKLAIAKALLEHGGNRTRAAKSLQISVRTLQRKLRGYESGVLRESPDPKE